MKVVNIQNQFCEDTEVLKKAEVPIKEFYINSPEELSETLFANNLFDIKDNKVPKLRIKNFPKNLNSLDVKLKKRLFFHSLIPMAMIAEDKIKKERKELLDIIKRYPSLKNLETEEFEFLSDKDKDIITRLSQKYQSSDINILKRRIDIVPISLVLSQSAIESSWGNSRFALQGNNLFGVWAKRDGSEKGIKPKYRKKGLKHMVKAYPSLQASIEDYCYKINTVRAYRYLRILRTKTKNSAILAKGLIHYSAKKEKYVKDVQKIIRRSRLQKYDNLVFID